MGPTASIVAAIACSAAAGKNPWIPLGLLFLIAAPADVPGFVMEPELHEALHGIGEPGLLYTLATIFLALATLESLADKLPFVQSWLVPISTAWRPFAGIAVASILAYAGIEAAPAAPAPTMEAADSLGAIPTAVVVVSVGSFAGWLATVAKTGFRLVLSMIPMPGLRLAHSFMDDFFALGATVAGLAFADSTMVAFVAIVYVLLGLFTGPILARLAWIYMRIVWATLRKAANDRNETKPPRWLARQLENANLQDATLLPAYTYRAPVVGRCRSGFFVLHDEGAWFACRAFFRPKILRIADASIVRLGLAETTTSRVVSLTWKDANDTTVETELTLFPASVEDTRDRLAAYVESRGWIRVDPASKSARQGMIGYSVKNRFYVASAGSLRAQALTTIVAGAVVGVLSGGSFIPIGAGYALSPFGARFAAGLGLSLYLTFCVFITLGIGWPAAVLYGVVLNLLALRDLARQSLKARVDGYVDTRVFLPTVCGHVWITEDRLESDDHRFVEGNEVVTHGSWRVALQA
ncbi:MAG: DUF4126 family protein [Myxococcota bacterium]